MPITLQSTVGGFAPAFMRQLPALERTIVAQGLDPSSFVISKDRATPPTVPLIGPFFYEYTVFIGNEHFTVTEPNDMQFLGYLASRIMACNDDEATVPSAPRSNLVSRFLRWMAQPV